MRKVFAAIALLYASLTMNTAVSARESDTFVVVDSGAAVYYSPSWDYGGWDAIIRKRIAWGQHDAATFPYNSSGHYCVHPDYVFGNVLTIRNRYTGAEATCTIADSVAPQDQANWRRHAAIEMSYRMFKDLDLPDGNAVEVLVMPGG
jgi:hypothetical protein